MPFDRFYQLRQAVENWLLGSSAVQHKNSCSEFDIVLVKPESVCPVCCEPSLSSMVCGSCLFEPPDYFRTQVVSYLNERLSNLIYDFKYHEQLAHSRMFAELMVEHIDFSQIDALVAVPSHSLRRRQRGYNQAEEIARQLGKALRIPVVFDAVDRVKATTSQTQLSRYQREQNLQGAFRVNADKLAGRQCIALIDDVITTGATMQALSRQLKKSLPDIRIQACALAKTRR